MGERRRIAESIDVNAVIAGLLRDLAAIQTAKPKTWGYKRAAAVVFDLEQPVDELRDANGNLPRIHGLGPSSLRVIQEALATGESASVEQAIDASGRRVDIMRRRSLRDGFLSRAAVLRVVRRKERTAPLRYRGDLQMHSEWSDGSDSIAGMASACVARGYEYCAITDHSHGLPFARGMSADAVRRQHRAIDRANSTGRSFRVLKGIEANIDAEGGLDLSPAERRMFDIVLAAPHAALRSPADQTPRMLRVVQTPGVQILAHPRGRKSGARAGIVADWDAIFSAAADRGVAIEIDGDPSRQDLDYRLAARARAAGCLFALDSDAHAAGQLIFAETAMAHARLAAIPASRIINTWPVARLLEWARALRE